MCEHNERYLLLSLHFVCVCVCVGGKGGGEWGGWAGEGAGEYISKGVINEVF